METLALFGQFLAGLGIFFVGVGVLWFVSVYSKNNTWTTSRFPFPGTVDDYENGEQSDEKVM